MPRQKILKKSKKWTDSLRQKKPLGNFGLEDVFFLLSSALAIFLLFASWIFRQIYLENPENRPHTHAESASAGKNLPPLFSEKIQKINTFEGLIYQNKKDPEKILEEESLLAEKIKKEEEEKKQQELLKNPPVKRKSVSPKPKRAGVPGPIYADTRNTKLGRVCKHNDDSPKKSNENPKGHIDTECCLDPDEIPNSNCYYPPEIYGKLIEKYLKKK